MTPLGPFSTGIRYVSREKNACIQEQQRSQEKQWYRVAARERRFSPRGERVMQYSSLCKRHCGMLVHCKNLRVSKLPLNQENCGSISVRGRYCCVHIRPNVNWGAGLRTTASLVSLLARWRGEEDTGHRQGHPCGTSRSPSDCPGCAIFVQ